MRHSAHGSTRRSLGISCYCTYCDSFPRYAVYAYCHHCYCDAYGLSLHHASADPGAHCDAACDDLCGYGPHNAAYDAVRGDNCDYGNDSRPHSSYSRSGYNCDVTAHNQRTPTGKPLQAQ